VTQARIGILGGTFDPIHLGHLIIATELRAALRLDRVRFVPAADPPHKPDQRLTPSGDRVAMIQCAIAGHSEFEIDVIELERPGPSFTNDTLVELHRREPDADFVFLMGADSLRDLPTWRAPERILALAEIGVALRPDVELDLAEIYVTLPSALGRVTVVPVPLIGISSRDLRQRAREGRPLAFQVPEAVAQYILEHQLYQSSNLKPDNRALERAGRNN
jgi:nicotinate-nucleotide adenylyltransferase